MNLEDLYALIPEVGCPEGCIACCVNFGVPSRTKEEDRRIRAYLKAEGRKLGKARGTRCPYVTSKGCSIYPVRPFICRLYGAGPSYRCRLGVQPLQLLHHDQEEELFYLYQRYFVAER